GTPSNPLSRRSACRPPFDILVFPLRSSRFRRNFELKPYAFMLKPGLTAKRICVLIWLATPIICLTIYLYDPHSFATESIVAFLRRFENEILILYIVISIARGFTLLPSTPLVIAGT